jgi:hypothetical protein
VEIVATYKLSNINRTKLENLIQRLFDPVRLNVEIKDRFGNPVVQREWFLVSLFVIDEAVSRIKDGTITGYQYDPCTVSLNQLPFKTIVAKQCSGRALKNISRLHDRALPWHHRQTWLSQDVALQGTSVGGIRYGAAGSVQRADEPYYHYGASPQALLSLRLILGDRAMLDVTGREYYVTGCSLRP